MTGPIRPLFERRIDVPPVPESTLRNIEQQRTYDLLDELNELACDAVIDLSHGDTKGAQLNLGALILLINERRPTPVRHPSVPQLDNCLLCGKSGAVWNGYEHIHKECLK